MKKPVVEPEYDTVLCIFRLKSVETARHFMSHPQTFPNQAIISFISLFGNGIIVRSFFLEQAGI